MLITAQQLAEAVAQAEVAQADWQRAAGRRDAAEERLEQAQKDKELKEAALIEHHAGMGGFASFQGNNTKEDRQRRIVLFLADETKYDTAYAAVLTEWEEAQLLYRQTVTAERIAAKAVDVAVARVQALTAALQSRESSAENPAAFVPDIVARGQHSQPSSLAARSAVPFTPVPHKMHEPPAPTDGCSSTNPAFPAGFPEQGKALVRAMARAVLRWPRSACAAPFRHNGTTVLLALYEYPDLGRTVTVKHQAGGWQGQVSFTHRTWESQYEDYDTVRAELKMFLPAHGLSDNGITQPFCFRVQQVTALEYPFPGSMADLVQLAQQADLPVFFFALDEQETPFYVSTWNVPLPPAAQESARAVMQQAEHYAQHERHTVTDWKRTEAYQLLQRARARPNRDITCVYTAIQQAYMRGRLRQGSIEELAELLAARRKHPEYFAKMGTKRWDLLRGLLEGQPSAALLLQAAQQRVQPDSWEQTPAAHLLRDHGAQGTNRIATYVYKATERAFRQGQLAGTRDELKEIALGQRRVEGIGAAGIELLVELLGIPPEQRPAPPLPPMSIHPKQITCWGHGTTGQAAYGFTDEDAPLATLLILTIQGHLAFSCVDCYPERQEHGWRYKGTAQEVVAESAEGFVHGARPYGDVYLALGGAAVGKCFSEDRRFWRSDPPTPIQVAAHTRRLRNPGIIARREQVVALVAALPQPAGEEETTSKTQDQVPQP